ncbi:MAG: hypothetical protein V3R27_10250 [Pseudomonadales bacterium]
MTATKNVLTGATTLLFAIGISLISLSVQAFEVNVEDEDGTTVAGFKWLLEEDNTHEPRVGQHDAPVPGDVTQNTLSLSFHEAHAPNVSAGESPVAEGGTTQVTLPNGDPLPAGRYHLSVLPFGDRSSCDGTFDLGGALVTVPTPDPITVAVRRNPIETAQVSVFVFHDNAPLNNAIDKTELPLSGFTVTLAEQGGELVQDAFGNVLGTTYLPGLDPATCEPTIDVLGSGDFVTDVDGEVIIKNLLPNKYGIEVEPPAGSSGWYQTSTLEGGKANDAWVQPNEPKFFLEFGGPEYHGFFGFVQETNILVGPGAAISGQVLQGHNSRPPDLIFHDGRPPETENVGERCLIGLNQLRRGLPGADPTLAEAVYIARCDEGGAFTIPNVPAGSYELVVWDMFLRHIITLYTVVADGINDLDLGNVVTPMWFGEIFIEVFVDTNENGMRDCVTADCDDAAAGDEIGIPEQEALIRFRDGSVNQAFPTDSAGFVPFQNVFPYFKWLVLEMPFGNFYPTGHTLVIDDGGAPTNDAFGEGIRNPQVQSDGSLARTELGSGVLVENFQLFQGQNLKVQAGRKAYDGDVNCVDNNSDQSTYDDFPDGVCDVDVDGDGGYNNNGAIAGIIYYGTTRAEDDPRFGAGEEWEPGIPNVQVNTYRDDICNSNGGPGVFPLCPEALPGEIGDSLPDNIGGPTTAGYAPVYADIDNYPLGWNEGGARGDEDFDRNGDGNFDTGDAIRVGWSDDWNENIPTDCPPGSGASSPNPVIVHGVSMDPVDCMDGLRSWNQARPGVFQGGWAIGTSADEWDPRLTPGGYVVEAATPTAYHHWGYEDRNVDFGITPTPAILPPSCVGDMYPVPALFSFLTDENNNPLPGVDPTDADNAPTFANMMMPRCDRKKLTLTTQQNAVVDFHLFTDVPKAARMVGLITDDLAAEITPNKPNFAEKYGPPWMSVSITDYTGQEVSRTYSDEFGAFNAMLASTYNINPPIPSGVGQKMPQLCYNHPGPIPDPANPGQFITDPQFRPQYSTTCYRFNFQPGTTTYIDAPVIRLAAFVGPNPSSVDCEMRQGTPVIRDVLGMGAMPAYVQGEGDSFTITALGMTDVPNPLFPGDNVDIFGTPGADGLPDDPPTEPESVTRNYGFGQFTGQSSVCVDDYCFPNSALAWSSGAITVTVPNGAIGDGLATGQLTVRRNTGRETVMGVTLTVGDTEPATMSILRVPSVFPTIQAAIDASDFDDLILVDPGEYKELPILHTRARLQGAGAYSTIINAEPFANVGTGANPLADWIQTVRALVASGNVGLLQSQHGLLDDLFVEAIAPAVFIAPCETCYPTPSRRGRVDGFGIHGATLGGGIYINAFARAQKISNNRLINNQGTLGGGIRVGNAIAGFPGIGVAGPSPNEFVKIHNNHILQNGSNARGGGVAIYSGATDYRVEKNYICGNYAREGGGGIGHYGRSDSGLIIDNEIVLNEVYYGDDPLSTVGGGGGGIEIHGGPEFGNAGSGDVTIDGNRIHGNLAGARDGGGIALNFVNGRDVADNPLGPKSLWHSIKIYDNFITNNATALAGGGISLQDATNTWILHNTIAHNDSTGTAAFAFGGPPLVGGGLSRNQSTPNGAGVISRAHSAALNAVLPGGSPQFSLPRQLRRNIIWQNRSYFWCSAPGAPGTTPDCVVPGMNPNPAGLIQDLDVMDGFGFECLNPLQGTLTSLTCNTGAPFHPSNRTADPLFVRPYFNCEDTSGNNICGGNALLTAATSDEGGNFVTVLWSPFTVTGNYHITGGSPVIDRHPGNTWVFGRLARDWDDEPRPGAGSRNNRSDTGADEFQD